jgi:hypothetical protein
VSLRTTELRPSIEFGKSTKQPGPVRRLYDTMKRHRELAVAVARPVILAVIAGLLILVVLPAALGAQAGTLR